MDTARLMYLFFQHLPDFLKRKFPPPPKENQFFASMTNISHPNEEDFIYDTDGCLLFMQTAQSNLSLFNISCDSLVFDDNKESTIKSSSSFNPSMTHSNSSFDLHYRTKKSEYHSTMIFSEDILSSNTNTLQRWQGLELLNTYA